MDDSDDVIVLSDDETGTGEEAVAVAVAVDKGNEKKPINDILIDLNEGDAGNKIPDHCIADEKQNPSTSTSVVRGICNRVRKDSGTDSLDLALDDAGDPKKRRKPVEILGNRDSEDSYHRDSFSQPVLPAPQPEPLPEEIPASGYEPQKSFPGKNGKITAAISIRRSISDGAFAERKRRKKRTREEIEAEQAAKKEAFQRIQQERIEKKKRLRLEKEKARFERDLAAAMKSKCEQNLFCVISLEMLASIERLGDLTAKVFEERNIRDQLLFDGDGMKICWKRRILEGEVIDFEFMYEQFCILSVNAQRYSEFRSAEEVAEFVGQSLQTYPFPTPRVTVVVYGLLKLGKEAVADFVLEIFERFRAQTRFILTVEEYAVLIAQMHRSIARNERHLVEKQNQPIVDVQKGITEGDNSSIVTDWWLKMLSQIHRMGSDAQRAIAIAFPNPHALLNQLRGMRIKDGMKLLADTKMDNGRRIGPVLGRKIYLILTSTNGTEIIDEI